MTPTHKKTMEGKTAVVTGSTSGIGEAIAKEMLERGANVMFHGIFRDDDQRQQFLAKLEETKAKYPNQKIDYVECDIGDYAAVEKLMKATAGLSPTGKIDALVNNAGIQIQKPIKELTPKEYDLVVKTNQYGPFFAAKAAQPYMTRGKGEGFSQITNISSVHGLVSSPERVAYCSAKHADEALMGVAAAEWAEDGIRVNNINPAFVQTELAMGPIRARAKNNVDTNGMGEDDAMAEALAWRLGNQGGKWVTLQEVADAAANLADFSDKRATGEDVVLDNGVYLERARQQGAAYFDKAGPLARQTLNRDIAKIELT